MAEANGELNVQNVQGSHAENVGMTLADAKVPAVDPNEPSAKALGVSDEQFVKYFNKDTKAYNWQAHAKEAEFKVAQRGEAKPDAPADTKPAGVTDDNAQSLVAKAGLDFDKLGSTIIETGDITQADYAALKAVGIPEDVVEDYIDGVMGKAKDHVKSVVDGFGGQDRMDAVAAWAQKTLSEEDLQAYNTQLCSKSEVTRKGAINELLQKAGLPPGERGAGVNSPNASGGGSGAAQGYASQSDMIADQKNPKYKTDPAFRSEVYAKARASKWDTNPRAHTSGL
ncbi:MAG: hypothetical protein GEU78_07905 [Actinobacteria bacterium]|nr:hypothetical protein [Actinomycetota bacterium]